MSAIRAIHKIRDVPDTQATPPHHHSTSGCAADWPPGVSRVPRISPAIIGAVITAIGALAAVSGAALWLLDRAANVYSADARVRAASLALLALALDLKAVGEEITREHARADLALALTLNGLAHRHREGWSDTGTILRLSGACLAATAFIAWEQGRDHPILSLHLFARPGFRLAGLMLFATGLASSGSTYLIPLFTQLIRHYSPTSAGLILFPAAIVMIVVFPLSGRLGDHVDVRWLLVVDVALFGGALGVNSLAVLLQERAAFHVAALTSLITEAKSEAVEAVRLLRSGLTQSGLAAAADDATHAQVSLASALWLNAQILAFRDCLLLLACAFAALMFLVPALPPGRVPSRSPIAPPCPNPEKRQPRRAFTLDRRNFTDRSKPSLTSSG